MEKLYCSRKFYGNWSLCPVSELPESETCPPSSTSSACSGFQKASVKNPSVWEMIPLLCQKVMPVGKKQRNKKCSSEWSDRVFAERVCKQRANYKCSCPLEVSMSSNDFHRSLDIPSRTKMVQNQMKPCIIIAAPSFGQRVHLP